jgi:hypothetical protein
MNTIETERLVRRIVTMLKGEGDPSMAPKLAEDFHTVCSSVALRLEQCRSMIEAGAGVQAVQLAETPPNLLDLVTVVEFRQAEEWRQLCRKKNLPVAEKLAARDVSILNECYSRGISPQHPVYAAYREATLARNDGAALLALKSITRLNPSDTNAAAELSRLDAKLVTARLTKLGGLLSTDPDAALKELESIEAFGFKSELSGDVWRKAQLVRSGRLLVDAEDLRDRSTLAEVVTLLDLLAQLQSDHRLVWPPEWEERVRALQAWCQTESAARQRDEEYREALAQLKQAIMLSEEKDTRARRVAIPELKGDREELHRLYRKVESFSRSIPDDSVQRFRKRSGLLQQQIERLTRIRVALMAAGAGVAVLLFAMMALAFLGIQRANAVTAELKKATDGRQVRALQTLLKQTGSKTILPTPRFKSASAAAASEVARELALLAEFEGAFQKLPRNLDGVVSMDQFFDVIGGFNRAEQAHRALSPDLLAETQPRLAGFRQRLTGQCETRLAALNQELNDQINAAETAAAVLNDTPDLERFRAIIAEVLPRLEQAVQKGAALGNFVKLRAELADRCQVLLERVRKDQAALGRLDNALAALARAEKTADVAAAVADLASVEIRQSDYARAARKSRAVLALKDDPEVLSRSLLVGTNANLWESILKAENPNFMPKKLSYEVRKRLMDLGRDYSVNGRHYRCRLHRDEQLVSYEEWITDGPLLNDDSWHMTQAWTVQDQGPCEFVPKQYGVFQGQYKFSDQKPAYGVRMTDLKALTGVWQDSGLSRLVDTRNQAYKLPPLKVADDIIAATSSSAIMRAYLLHELLGFMAAEPVESGLVFCPQLRVIAERLRSLGVDRVRSGDWFVPSFVTTLQPKFDQFFALLQGVSFFKQASGLLSATTRAAKSGFTLAGYAGPDGAPVWKSPPGNDFIWGLSEAGGLPALLFIVNGGEARKVTAPLPLTPLLVYQGDLAAIINESGVRPDDPSFKGQLPPLFMAPVSAP